VEGLRVHWAELLAGVSACRELEVLVLPRIEVEPLFPPGTAFGRLTHLDICDYEREHSPDAGVVGLWELMASGGLPALAKLRVRLEGRWGGLEEVRTRVVPAFEAVAGTLRRLQLENEAEGKSLLSEEGLLYEWGLAVGKLRRLNNLSLDLGDGWAYLAVAQGLAVSGGDRPLPLLWRVEVASYLDANADLLASLLLPSVWVFVSSYLGDGRATLLVACALRQAGFKHTWITNYWLQAQGARAVASCRFRHVQCPDRFWNLV
jgi:hypothetical protein